MKPKILIILFILSVFLISCWEKNIKTYYLSDIDNQMIPYKLGDTVNFIDSLGNSFVMEVTDDIIRLTEMDREDTERYEYRDVTLISKSSNLKMLVGVQNGTNRIVMQIKPIFSFYIYIEYNKEGQLRTYTADNNKQCVHDSLEINNFIYYDVADYTISKISSYVERLPFRVLYNKKEGLLQLEDKDKVLFSIVNKNN